VKLTKEDIVTLKVLRQTGETNQAIAARLGISEGAVRYHLKRQAQAATDGRKKMSKSSIIGGTINLLCCLPVVRRAFISCGLISSTSTPTADRISRRVCLYENDFLFRPNVRYVVSKRLRPHRFKATGWRPTCGSDRQMVVLNWSSDTAS